MLSGTDTYGRFPLLMGGGLLTSIPTFQGLYEIKNRMGFIVPWLFLGMYLFVCICTTVCSDSWNTDTTLPS